MEAWPGTYVVNVICDSKKTSTFYDEILMFVK